MFGKLLIAIGAVVVVVAICAGVFYFMNGSFSLPTTATVWNSPATPTCSNNINVSPDAVQAIKLWNISNPQSTNIPLDGCSSAERINKNDFYLHLGEC